jgi:pimeloyl-ACP methyl ester carboxylesterase
MGELWPSLNVHSPLHAVALDVSDWNGEVYCAILGRDPERRVGGNLVGLDFSNRLRAVSVPVLLTFGRHDRAVFPELAARFREALPEARFIMFEQSGHAPYAEENGRYLAEMRKFLVE